MSCGAEQPRGLTWSTTVACAKESRNVDAPCSWLLVEPCSTCGGPGWGRSGGSLCCLPWLLQRLLPTQLLWKDSGEQGLSPSPCCGFKDSKGHKQHPQMRLSDGFCVLHSSRACTASGVTDLRKIPQGLF